MCYNKEHLFTISDAIASETLEDPEVFVASVR